MSDLCLPITSSEMLWACLPHRPPIILIDQILMYSESNIVVEYTIPTDGLFVSNGRFMEPGIVENMAQSAAAHTGLSFFLRDERAPLGYIGDIRNLRIHSLPILGYSINTHVYVKMSFGNVTIVDIITKQADQTIAIASMKTVTAA